MYFGYRAHREHGPGWNEPRSGRQMKRNPGYALRWHRLKAEAETNGEIERLIDARQRHGLEPPEIVDTFDKDADGTVAELRSRKAALVGPCTGGIVRKSYRRDLEGPPRGRFRRLGAPRRFSKIPNF
jgi:hypothetical protein